MHPVPPRHAARRRLAPLFACALLVLCAGPVAAQQARDPQVGNGAAPPPGSNTVTRAALRSGEVRIDGRIDEAAWAAAPVASGFVTSEPLEGAAPTRSTDVRVLLDDQAVYVSARMWDHPDSVSRQLSRRDERGPYMDWFGVSIDANLDRRTAYTFKVNSSGVQQDIYHYDDRQEDMQWNAVWESAVAIDSLGWTVELRIPLSQIRYNSSPDPQTWGINFHRRRTATGELSHFSLESRRDPGKVGQMGTMEGVVVSSSVRRVEARPYVVGSLHRGTATEGDPFFDGSALGRRFGSDFRLGLGSAFTLDATVNPDFGQVEADPAVINLTAFESFFDERRPFFVEDAQVFDFGLSGGQNQLFYGRRIGRSPRVRQPAGATFVDVPDATTILGAGKLTGRTVGGLSLGALVALTAAETGRAFHAGDGTFSDFAAEPGAGQGAFALRQDLRGGESQVSGIFTALRRSLPADGVFDFLPEQAFSLGTRFDHQWSERQWRVYGFLAGSHVRGTSEAITRIQRASNHYFQRPDGTRASVDSAATSISGAEWRLQLDRQNRPWTGAIWAAQVTKGFEINDMGFSGTRERLDGGLRVGYSQLRPGRIFRDYGVTFNSFHNFSHEALDDPWAWTSWRRAYMNGTFSLATRLTFLSLANADINFNYRPDFYSRNATRGGPVMIQPGGIGGRLGYSTDRRQSTSVGGGVNWSRASRDNGNEVSFDLTSNWRPSPQLQINLQPRFSVQSDGSQYVTATSTLPYAPTFGRRYFFGELERTTLSLQTRVNYTFSPTLTLEFFAQPLLSSGDFVAYKQLSAPSSYDFQGFAQGQAQQTAEGVVCAGGSICRDASGTQHVDLNGDGRADFSFRDRDFNVRSLVGNLVLRWEYRPGSTLFVVWQRSQQGDDALGDFRFRRDLDALWGAPTEDRFMVKFNYWLGL